MRLFLAALLFTLAAAAQQFPQAVDLVQRIDQLYPWLQVVGFDVDAQGDIYLAGSAKSPIPDILTTHFGPLGGSDIVVIKFDPVAQRMLYAVAIGGSSDDSAYLLRVDAVGNVYLIAYTSSDFPIVYRQGSRNSGPIVLKLNPSGALAYSTLLSWDLTLEGFTVDSAGAVYLSGTARQGELPTSPTSYFSSPDPNSLVPGFVAKLNPSGQALDAATYVAGDISHVLVRASGDVLVAGETAIEAFNSSLSQRLFFTSTNIEPFFTDSDTGSIDIGQDDSGNIYAAGLNALRKYSPDGQQLLVSLDFPTATWSQFAVSHSGIVYLVGGVPPNFPTHNATQPCLPDQPTPVSDVSGSGSGLLLVVGPDNQSRYATYIAEHIDLMSGKSVSTGPYALADANLTVETSQWKGILRFNAEEIPGDHTAAACLTNAGTLRVTAIAPGTILALFGDHLGPQDGVPFTLQDQRVPFNLAGTSLTVDGKPAPMLYAQNSQINFVAPWSVRTDGALVPVCVTTSNDRSCLYAPTFSIDPGFFFTATNVIAAINQDGTINAQDNPAKPGSYVSVYLTGGGAMDGTVADGGIAGLDLQRLTAMVSATFTFKLCNPGCSDFLSLDAPVLFAGAVPTLVYGANVVIVQVPSHPNSLSGVQFTLGILQPGRTVDSTASGDLFVSP